MKRAKHSIEVFKGVDGEWRCRIQPRNNAITWNTESYSSYTAAVRAGQAMVDDLNEGSPEKARLVIESLPASKAEPFKRKRAVKKAATPAAV